MSKGKTIRVQGNCMWVTCPPSIARPQSGWGEEGNVNCDSPASMSHGHGDDFALGGFRVELTHEMIFAGC